MGWKASYHQVPRLGLLELSTPVCVLLLHIILPSHFDITYSPRTVIALPSHFEWCILPSHYCRTPVALWLNILLSHYRPTLGSVGGLYCWLHRDGSATVVRRECDGSATGVRRECNGSATVVATLWTIRLQFHLLISRKLQSLFSVQRSIAHNTGSWSTSITVF